jgi:lysyl-tRNA synthetase class I
MEAELENIRNVILNTQERETQEEYVPPICPTPNKRKYSNREHALPFAAKWRQNAYECDCGFWHLSKQSGSEHKAKINSPPAAADEFDAVDPLML